MKLSLVLPVYNEEKNIHKGSVEKVVNYLKTQNFSYEILIVDDGSTDKTTTIIKKKYTNTPHLRLIEKDHEGKAFSIKKGIEESKGELVAFSDFDLATPIDELQRILTPLEEGCDIVIGSRRGMRKGAPFTRKILSKGLMIIRDGVIGLGGIKDTQCGFKAFKKDKALTILSKLKVFKVGRQMEGPSVGAAFDLEFLFIAKKLGFTIKEVPVDWTHVETKNVNFIRDAYESLKDIFKIRIFALTGQYK